MNESPRCSIKSQCDETCYRLEPGLRRSPCQSLPQGIWVVVVGLRQGIGVEGVEIR